MPDEQTSSPESENASESAEVDTPTEETETPETEESQKDTEEPELDAESARKALVKARKEAGNYRTKLREAEAKLSAAKTPEEVEAAVNELKATNAKLERDLLVRDVADAAKLPKELAELLQGSTKAELEAHAKKLAKFVVTDEPSGDLRGGLDPTDEDTFDPVKVAHAAKASRY